jgi:hypothetical protein
MMETILSEPGLAGSGSCRWRGRQRIHLTRRNREGHTVRRDAGPWVNSLPLAQAVFSGDLLIEPSSGEGRSGRPLRERNQASRDEEDLLERAITRGFSEPAEDSHLEDFYDWRHSGDEEDE